jgi:hypothetical protein
MSKVKKLFTPGSQAPYTPPNWIDANCSPAMLRGRLKANLEIAQQASPDSLEHFNCMKRAAHLERLLHTSF